MRFVGTKAGSRGFTLLEILVALAILAIAGTLVLQLFSANLRAVSLSGDWTAAAVRVDARLREILADMPPAAGAWTETTDDGYRMDVSVTEVLKDRTDTLPVRMMEVSLTIRWTRGGRERSLVVTSARIVDRMAREDQA